MLIKDNFGNLGISVYNMPVSCTSRVIEAFALGGGGQNPLIVLVLAYL